MVLDEFRLDGRVALVTGANRGIGQRLVTGARRGRADVALLGRSQPVETQRHIEGCGRRATGADRDLATASPAERARSNMFAGPWTSTSSVHMGQPVGRQCPARER